MSDTLPQRLRPYPIAESMFDTIHPSEDWRELDRVERAAYVGGAMDVVEHVIKTLKDLLDERLPDGALKDLVIEIVDHDGVDL